MGMGCTLYPAGSTAGYTLRGHRGHAYERHPWSKGWPIVSRVVVEVLHSQVSTYQELLISEPCVSIYPQHLSALLAHSCTFIGFSVGNADRPNAPHAHRFFSGRVTWRRTGGVL